MPVPELSAAASGRLRPRFRFLRLHGCLPVLLLATAVAGPLNAAARPTAAASPAVPIEPVMAGEFALQAGQLPDAARWYLEAAQAAEGDILLAERATRIAMLANDDAKAEASLRLWRQRAPDSLALRAATASLALRQGQIRKARRELVEVLKAPDPRAWRYALVALAGGRDPAVIGKVMGQVMPAFRGRADGKVINQIVREELQRA